MGIESGFDPGNLEDTQGAELPQSGLTKEVGRRRFVRGAIGAALGAVLVRHQGQTAKAQEVNSTKIVFGTGPKENPNGDASVNADEKAAVTSPQIVQGTGPTEGLNEDASVSSGENSVATSSATGPLANDEGSQIVNPAEQSGEFNYLNGRLDGPLDINREYLPELYPSTDGQASAESFALQSGLRLIVNPDGSVVLDYDVQSVANPQVRARQPKVDYFVLYPTPDDYEKKEGVVVQATADTQNLENDADAMSLFNGGQFRGYTIEAVGHVDGKQNVVLAQTGGMNMGVSVSNDRPGVTESQTTPETATEAAATEAAPATEIAPATETAGGQDNQEGHGSGLLATGNLAKGVVGLGVGAAIGAAIKGKKREGE